METDILALENVDYNLLGDEIVQKALDTGVDLRQYAQQVETELKEVENVSIQDYIRESQNIASLHNQITACDDILERMEKMLLTFQSDLGSISHEIQSLQAQSISMNVKLKNRQAILGNLSQFVDEMVISEKMIKHLSDASVTDPEFMNQLHVLDQKVLFVKEQSFKDIRSCQDVSDVLEKLKIKSITKIREYILKKVFSFRKPMANYQVAQDGLLKHKFFYKFLLANERDIAREVREEYVDTMSKVYYSYFKTYSSRLMKLQNEDSALKDDLLGIEEGVKKGFFTTKMPIHRSTVFTLGRRGEILSSSLESPIVVPHAAQKVEEKYPFEAIFRSLQFAVVDNGCREYLFLSEFFMVTGTGAQELFNSVMGRTLTLFMKQMETFTPDCYDCIALLLSIHVIYRFKLLCHKRAVPALDQYWDNMLKVMWPRFEHVLQMNIQSLRDCDPRRLGSLDNRPHYIPRRYAEFSSSLSVINDSFPGDNDNIDQLLYNLQGEMEALIYRMAAEFTDRKGQLVFLINNYDMMLAIVTERAKDDSKEAENFRERLNILIAQYVEEMLNPHFGGLIQFVKDGEKFLDASLYEELKKEERKVLTLIKTFSASWKKSLDDIDKEIKMSFPNFKNGNNILQATLTQFIQHYHRFNKLLSQNVFKNVSTKNELMNIHQLMVEVKRYKPSF